VPAGGLDLDLEFDLPSPARGSSPSGRPMLPPADELPLQLPERTHADGGVDLAQDGPPLAQAASPVPQPQPVPPSRATEDLLDFDLSGFGSDEPALKPAGGDNSLDFADFDLGAPPSADAASLTRKLELAEEFRQIGDSEGARDLLEEVLAKAEGALKTKAQGMLDQLARG
jgi:pilus assembly protein FimV